MIAAQIFQDWFSTREMREIFSDRNTVQQWLNAEAALAQAQAARGVIPPRAAETITQKADAALIALEPLRERYQVDDAGMRQNLEITRGLVMAEAVMMSLARKVGRNAVHELLYAASMGAFTTGGSFEEALQQNPGVRDHFSAEEISKLLDPAGYLGEISDAVDRVAEPT